MSSFSRLYYLFSHFTGPEERKVGIFFSKLSEKNVSYNNYEKLINLVQDNLVAVNLWNERNFKGYDYLTKAKRKELYENSVLIVSDFNDFVLKDNPGDVGEILAEISKLSVNTDKLRQSQNKEKLQYLHQIMRYLSPKSSRYVYRESSSFGELLKDPSKNTLQGDCNQIVTLYIYLYSRKYSVKDLQLKTYPGHVALHFMGVDIEATNGEFANYDKDEQRILPVQEIISVNLLDTTDSYFQTHQINPKSFLQSARLAYLVSSEKQIVNNNLVAAYHNVVNDLLRKDDFVDALKYAKLSNQPNLVQLVGHNGAAYYLNNNKFADAKKYAAYSADEHAFLKKIHYNEGINHFNNKEFQAAITAFKSIGETELVKKCYKGMYFEEQNKLSKMQTTDEIKQNRPIIHHLQDYAKRSGDADLIEHAAKLGKYL